MADTPKTIVASPINHTFTEAVAAEYWTEARRAAVKPILLPRVTAGPVLHPLPTLSVGTMAATVLGHGTEATVHPILEAFPKSPIIEPLPLHLQTPVETHVPSPVLKTEMAAVPKGGQPVAAPLNYPYRTVGKIFFNQGSGGFSGSAAMVAPNVLLTAGHCVFEGGNWSTNMTFYPSYGKRAANDPAYKFACGRLACWSTWHDTGEKAHDYGLVWMGQNPGNIVGWLGLLWNAPTAGRIWNAVGYPATPNPPFNGNTMDGMVGSAVASSTSGTLGLSNDNMEHGSSGGPWITAWNEATPTHANGVQSFHVNDGDFTEYGPYFTQDIKSLFDWISNPANH